MKVDTFPVAERNFIQDVHRTIRECEQREQRNATAYKQLQERIATDCRRTLLIDRSQKAIGSIFRGSSQNALIQREPPLSEEGSRLLLRSIGIAAGVLILLFLIGLLPAVHIFFLFGIIGGFIAYWIVAFRMDRITKQKEATLLAQARREYDEQCNRNVSQRQQEIRRLVNRCRSLCQQFAHGDEQDFLGIDWNDKRWQTWEPSKRKLLPLITRIGTFTLPQLPPNTPSLPLFVTPLDSRNLIFKCGDRQGLMAAKHIVKSLLTRLLATQPPGKIHFTFIDADTLGENARAFMALRDFDPALVTTRAWVEKHDIERQLQILTDHIEYINHMYLRGDEFHSLMQYNVAQDEVIEPYRVLVVWDFPVNFSEEAADRLTQIAKNGPRCGVTTIVINDTSTPLPGDYHAFDRATTKQLLTGRLTGNIAPATPQRNSSFSTRSLAPEELDSTLPPSPGSPMPESPLGRWESASDIFEWNGDTFTWQNEPDFTGLTLNFDSFVPMMQAILDKVGEASKGTKVIPVSFKSIVPQNNQYWKGNTIDGISVPVGRPLIGKASSTRQQLFELGGDGTTHHALVGGTIGSGKTVLLQALLTNLLLHYGPDEVKMYLIDFKDVSFITFARYRFPHIRVLATQSDREYALSIFKEIDQEFKNRQALFKQASIKLGKQISKISDYRKALSAEKLPRVLLIIDELQVLFADEGKPYDDDIAKEALDLLSKFAKEARAFGIHMILATQTLKDLPLIQRKLVGQIGLRIGLKCNEAEDSQSILGERNPDAIHLMGKGHGIYNSNPGRGIVGNQEFQSAFFDGNDMTYLDAVQLLAKRYIGGTTEKTIIFDGYKEASVEDNEQLQALLDNPKWQSSNRDPMIWLGEPMSISTQPTLTFQHENGSNLLIVGPQPGYASGIIVTSLFTLAAQFRPMAVCFYLLDFSTNDTFRSTCAQFMHILTTHKPQYVQRKQVPSVIEELSEELNERNEADTQQAQRIFVFIFGSPRQRDMDTEVPDGSGDTVAARLECLFKQGSEVGIHMILWCDKIRNIEEVLGSRVNDAFDKKILFNVPADDVRNITGMRIILQEPDRAFFHSDDESRDEKFRPYILPSETWMEKVVEAIQKKQ